MALGLTVGKSPLQARTECGAQMNGFARTQLCSEAIVQLQKESFNGAAIRLCWVDTVICQNDAALQVASPNDPNWPVPSAGSMLVA